MTRKVFFSFEYKPDSWRASQVRNMGVVEGNAACSDNDWEEVTSGGDDAIKTWIKDQMSGRSCAIVLVGSSTAGRKWINFEIEHAWNSGKGVLGVHIHGLKNALGNQGSKGKNPFRSFTLGEGDSAKNLADVVKCYDSPYQQSGNVYTYIKDNIESWIEEAIEIRNDF
jgi:hypothetical protein